MKKLILLVVSGFMLSSCNNNPKKATATQETITKEEHHHNSDLLLNHGQKWTVNNEMRPFVLEGENLVNSYLKNEQNDYKTLASQLKAQNNQLVKSCTMNRPSHEELHKWLQPHLELVNKLKNESEVTKATEIVSQLQASYQVYHQYFN